MDKYNDIQQEKIEERIDSFIRGTMSEEEEAAFKQEIKADPELRAQVLATVSLIKGIRNQESAKEKELIQENTIQQRQANKRARSIMLWASSIAAIFIVVFGAVLFFPKSAPIGSEEDQIAYSPKSGGDMDANDIPPHISFSPKRSIDDVYSRGNLDSTNVAHLNILFKNIQNNRDISNSIKKLETLYAALDTDFTYNAYANDIAWHLALAYINNNQKDKAIPVLEKLVKDNPETPIATKATELLNKLQD